MSPADAPLTVPQPSSADRAGSLASPPCVPQVLREAALECPDRIALVDGNLRLTYAQLNERVNATAAGLIALGLKSGDRVGLWAPNCANWVVAALATLAAGGVLVPVNTRFKGAEARYVLARSGARMLLAVPEFLGVNYLDLVRDGRAGTADCPLPQLPDVRTVVLLPLTGDPTPQPEEAGVIGLDELVRRGRSVAASTIDERIDAIDPDAMGDLIFTSGTTGEPKGAMTSHRANVATNQAWSDGVGLREGDRYLLLNPLFHSFGYRAGLVACLLKRASMVLLATFDVPLTLRLIEDEKITVFPAAPAVFTTLLDAPRDGLDLSSVRLVVTGAAVVPVTLIRRIRDELGFGTVITAYGQTETAGTATVCPPDAPDEKISATSGRAIPGVEVAIWGADGTPLPSGEPGEIMVRGPNVMLGYYQDPAATAAAVEPTGWLHTGDVGFLDEQGYLVITDRIKDMFTMGGFNVYPAEIERVLVAHPGVADAAVVGVPDERMGEVGRAFVVRRPGAAITPEDLIAHCREHLANYKVPREVSFVAELPRTPSGKVQKFRLPTG